MNIKASTIKTSSIKVWWFRLEILREVMTIKQKPSKLDEVFRIWDNFFLLTWLGLIKIPFFVQTFF